MAVSNLGMGLTWAPNANALTPEDLRRQFDLRRASDATPESLTAMVNAVNPIISRQLFGADPSVWVNNALERSDMAGDQEQAALNQYLAQRQQNQTQLQNAYNLTQSGGNYTGGVINDQYGWGTPDMSAQNPWAQFQSVSYGGPMGGFGGAAGQTYSPAPKPPGGMNAPSGWGGPFSNTNPWAAS